MRVIASWSGGKDSCLALYEAVQAGHEVACLLNFLSKGSGRCCFHGIPAELARLQARCLSIDIVQREVSPDMTAYEEEFKDAVAGLKKDRKIEGMVFGDIYLDEHRQWVERVCTDLAIRPLEPLWHKPPAEVFDEFTGLGFKAVVTSARYDLFDGSFVGRDVDSDLKRHLEEKGVCVCGENGEYHTFVGDGPIFRDRIEITKAETVVRDGFWKHWFLDIQSYRIESKGQGS